MLASVAGEVPVVVVDHCQARAHEPGELEDGDAGAEREGGVGVSQVVGPAERLDTRRELRLSPFPRAEVAQIDVAATRSTR